MGNLTTKNGDLISLTSKHHQHKLGSKPIIVGRRYWGWNNNQWFAESLISFYSLLPTDQHIQGCAAMQPADRWPGGNVFKRQGSESSEGKESFGTFTFRTCMKPTFFLAQYGLKPKWVISVLGTNLSIYQSIIISPWIHQCINLSISVSICLSIIWSIRWYIYLCVDLFTVSMYIFIYPILSLSLFYPVLSCHSILFYPILSCPVLSYIYIYIYISLSLSPSLPLCIYLVITLFFYPSLSSLQVY